MKLKERYEILKTMKAELSKTNGRLTPLEHDFFVFLVQFVNQNGTFDEEENMYCIRVPFKLLAEKIGVNAKLVTPALKKLKENNLIKIKEITKRDKIIFLDLNLYAKNKKGEK